MSLVIRWKIPADILSSATAHTIRVYRSTAGENEEYSLIDTVSAGSGNTTRTYTDSGGATGFWYYVRYVPSGGDEGDRVLAIHEAGITEQRLAEQINEQLPEIIKARIDTYHVDIRRAMKNSLDIINAYSPQTSYTMTNLPGRFEAGIVLLTLTLLYLEKYLQISIRDYSYGATGINFTVDRGARINTAVTNLRTSVDEILKFLKHGDWPIAPIGLGTEALATPQARIYGFLNMSS